jgi:tight adherence protein C
MTMLVATTWAILLLAVLWAYRPAPRRVRLLLPATTPGEGAPAQLGRWVRARAGRPADSAADRQTGWAMIAAAAALAVAPPLVLVVALWWRAGPLLNKRRATRYRSAAIADALPDVAELLQLTTDAGLTIPLAVPLVARRVDGPVGAALLEVAAAAERGVRWADAVAALPERLGPVASPLASALTDHERYGTALAPALARATLELRLERRRRAERIARRVPVRLLFPLVLCVLPAFALLTIVPLLAGALRGLRL